MAKHGNGTYDPDKKQWKVRTKELKASATIRKLAKMFMVDLPRKITVFTVRPPFE